VNIPQRVCLVLFLCLPGLCSAQSTAAFTPQSAPFSQSPASAADAAAGLIQLDVVVTDKAGKQVAGLDRSSFTLLDNGQPAKTLSFHAFDGVTAKPDPPVEVVLVIDTIDMPSKLASYEEQEVERFLRQNGSHLGRPVLICLISRKGLSVTPQSSSDGNALAAWIVPDSERRSISGAENAMGEDPPGLLALKALGSVATSERRKPGRKLLVWIGPGRGVGSGAPIEGVEHREYLFHAVVWFSTLLREARITLYSISAGETDYRTLVDPGFLNGVKSARQANFDNLDRKVLALQSGGRVLEPVSDLASQIDSCVEEASAFYSLSFDPLPANVPNEYHDLEVQVNQPGLTVRTGTGYYDQPYYSDRLPRSARRVTVEQLEHVLQAVHGKLDAEIAGQLYNLELTERLSGSKLLILIAGLHGEKSRQALVELADTSAFLDPPRADIPADAPPDPVAQAHMISAAVDYVNNTLSKLPNFFATRTTVRYEETPEQPAARDSQLIPPDEPREALYYTSPDYAPKPHAGIESQPLHVATSASATVLYRNDNDVVDSGELKPEESKTEDKYLTANGTFGLILGTVVVDAIAAPSRLTWNRWEQGAGGPLAVFRYVVPLEKSHYQVEYCCRLDGDGTGNFQKVTGYHGEIAINPASGTVLRLVLEADLKQFVPVDRSETMVEYGPVEIGGKTYICPVRSVSISRDRTVVPSTEWNESFKTFGPYMTMLNDVVFKGYHIFRAESRVLPGFEPSPDQK
jgi:VWFA-related protein